jgi:hypothetical protein
MPQNMEGVSKQARSCRAATILLRVKNNNKENHGHHRKQKKLKHISSEPVNQHKKLKQKSVEERLVG